MSVTDAIDRKELGVDRRDVDRMKKVRVRERFVYAAIGAIAAVLSFSLGVIAREELMESGATYPYAAVATASASGGAAASNRPNRRLIWSAIMLLSTVSLTLGILLTEGHAPEVDPSIGVVPEYGVFHPRYEDVG
jgi:hypothetical protein